MSFSTIPFMQKSHTGYIKLDRPEKGNRITWQMAQELRDVCALVNQNDSVYVVVLTGAGDTFCTGSEDDETFPASVSIAAINCPVIAAINGPALGQGLELTLACDIRISSNTATFTLPQVAAGYIPADGGTQRLSRIIGKGKTLELVLTGEIISAEAALEIGLVSRVVPAEKLAGEAEMLAQTIAEKAPIALRYIKEAVNGGLDLTLEQGLRLEADLYFLLHTTLDRTEGIRAFLEKRKPEFRGK